jgi:hypothetical protein
MNEKKSLVLGTLLMIYSGWILMGHPLMEGRRLPPPFPIGSKSGEGTIFFWT